LRSAGILPALLNFNFANGKRRLEAGATGYLPRAIARLCVSIFIVAPRIHEAQGRRIGKMNAHLVGDVAQRIIKVRQMTAGEIAHEGALNFVITHPAMQPTQKKRELHEGGNKYGDP
jgi:hypothetical protein